MAETPERKQNENGFIEWNISENLLKQFKDEEHEQYSPQFQTIDGSIWRIRFYPHGNESTDHCSVFLECVELIADKPRIGVNYSFNIKEVNWEEDTASTFDRNGQATGYSKAFKAETLNDLNSLSIMCKVEETMDVTQNNAYFKWKISNYLMQKWKNAKYKQSFYSPIFNAIGCEWYLRIYPNGCSTKEITELDIYCEDIESDGMEINACYCVEIDAFDHLQMNLDGSTIKTDDFIECKSPFKWNDLQKEAEITICCRICEAKSISSIIPQINKLQLQSLETIRCLREKDEKLTQENVEMRAELDKVAMKGIKTFDCESAIDAKKDIMIKQKEFESKLQIDENRLNEWKKDTNKIETELKAEEKENDDQEMKDLLNRFMKCKKLCDTQQNRMENVLKYSTKLNQMKKILKKERTQSNEMMNKKDKEYNDLDERYQTLQKQRTELQKEWKHVLKQMNETIDLENNANESKCYTLKEHNICHLESEEWNELRTKCGRLIKEYRVFDVENEENIEKLKQMFDKLWNESMKRWIEWQPHDIIAWMKYLHIKNELTLSKEFDSDYILNEMVKSKMSGLSFTNVDKSDLKTVGVMTLNDRQQIYHKINELIAKYPQMQNDPNEMQSIEGQIKTNNIPAEFICPLSKKIMKEPVRIFDNYTYEKQAIVNYLKQYNKSPITGEECDDDDDDDDDDDNHWILTNRKLKEKIKIFLAVNNISFDDMDENETVFID